MEILKILGIADKYAIIGNGVLKSKALLKEQAEARKESAGAAASDAGTNGGGKSNARDGEGDNGVAEEDNNPKTPDEDPANQRPEQTDPSISDEESGTIAASRVLPRRGRAGGFTSDISKTGTPASQPKGPKKK